MKVYLVYSLYYDHCNEWEKLVAIFKDVKDANTEVFNLIIENEDNQTSFFIREWEVQ